VGRLSCNRRGQASDRVRGAFTGASFARAGLFESANGGTIFLDEVGDLPLSAQVKLLRALQEGEIKRVGSDETKVVDVRVVAATNVDLLELVASGAFRRDLFYRLNVIPVTLPPLRDRGDDAFEEAYLRELMQRCGGNAAEAAREAGLDRSNFRRLLRKRPSGG
jgi:transcriptional regulator with GAF, ATPase, and Fis domain